ncbi:MAG TPA: recombinase family protein [Terracidiphilus sp.]
MISQEKVATEHLQRLAYLYVRQSSLHQVHEHRESTARQYALKRRAQALGWSAEQLIIVDEDQGLSGASAAERSGFQRMVAEVGLGRVGVVMGLEVSRLARNSADWHRLLEICALSNTLILDEDGVYDPSHFNDRLLLGLKGTMSEAELHLLRARLLGVSSTKRGVGNCGFAHRSVMSSTRAPAAWSWTPTSTFSRSCVCCLRPFVVPARL